jgi:hypothetical protein
VWPFGSGGNSSLARQGSPRLVSYPNNRGRGGCSHHGQEPRRASCMEDDYNVTVSGMSETPTLYEWAGGRDAIKRMIGCFYDRVEHDDLLSPLFPGGVSVAHREHVTT